MTENLQNYKIVLDQAEKELKTASGAQNSRPDDYWEAKKKYIRAYNAFVEAMNKFCDNYPNIIQFDKIDKANQYDH